MSGLLNLFPYDIAEKILYKYFFGIDKEKDDHEKAKGELLLERITGSTKIFKTAITTPENHKLRYLMLSFTKNRSFLKHIIQLVAVIHDCNCCHRHQINKPAFIKTVDSPEEHKLPSLQNLSLLQRKFGEEDAVAIVGLHQETFVEYGSSLREMKTISSYIKRGI